MRTVYALFVGIDDYPKDDLRLRGCVGDVRAAERWLAGRRDLELRPRPLYDSDATRAAVLDGIAGHLGRGGPGDTVLLWFSGHGSQQETDDPREATGMAQALVCHDSLVPGGQPLFDSELGALLDDIAGRGAHVLAVLDCCYSGGATRADAGERTRGAAWQAWWRVPRSRDAHGGGPVRRRHVLLAASRLDELAYEIPVGGEHRGLFSHTVLDTLDRTGAAVTYRKLHSRVHARVQERKPLQHPDLVGHADQHVLTGAPAPAAPFLLRHTAGGWQVDCGLAHGLRAAGCEFTVLDETVAPEGTVAPGDAAGPGGGAGPRPGARVVVREVRAETADVEPVGWRPGPGDPDRVYPVTPSALAFPPTEVAVAGGGPWCGAVRAALGAAPGLAPAGGDGSGHRAAPLRCEVTESAARVVHPGVDAVRTLPLRSPGDVARLVDCLSHIARWRRLRDLVNPDPSLSALVRVTLEPLHGAMTLSPAGEYVFAYGPDGSRPRARVRIHNDSPYRLWCVLLDLTDSYAADPALYEGDFVGPRRRAVALGGAPVDLWLPPDRPFQPGASVQDWLKLLVTENELNTAPFLLPAWSPDAPATRGAYAPDGPLRFTSPGPASGSRDMGAGPRPAADPGRWGTALVPVRTVVP
ncbi:caspase family protein [Streptomyces sp. TRM S81-3]|uniref:Caspase family protein n=1 Tax=Streptomyces griseicoloratus TaxID=2752516 RepID=A0A926LCZ3_9ACTN|nr:caspase family protein [Streptomyces griseicoloratus]MBD0424521.1 caspase family protein [Streptomyces griseicoloratus]